MSLKKNFFFLNLFLLQRSEPKHKAPFEVKGTPCLHWHHRVEMKKRHEASRNMEKPGLMKITVPKFKWYNDIKYCIYLELDLHQFINCIAEERKIVLLLIQ